MQGTKEMYKKHMCKNKIQTELEFWEQKYTEKKRCVQLQGMVHELQEEIKRAHSMCQNVMNECIAGFF